MTGGYRALGPQVSAVQPQGLVIQGHVLDTWPLGPPPWVLTQSVRKLWPELAQQGPLPSAALTFKEYALALIYNTTAFWVHFHVHCVPLADRLVGPGEGCEDSCQCGAWPQASSSTVRGHQ